MNLADTFIHHFEEIKDPRKKTHNLRHEFIDILIIAILACICDADGFTEICEFAQAKQEWLSTFLKLPHGIPSHDTFGRVFALINPQVFEACFCEWIASLSIDILNEIIAIDGKTARRSHNRNQGCQALHMVSAWATQQQVLLGQVKTEEKSNEIEAIPKLLDMLDVEGSIITIDAMGCQQAIAKKVLSQGADYVLSLKENHKSLYDSVGHMFMQAEAGEKFYKNILHRRKIEKAKGHGRYEIRTYTLVSARDVPALQCHWPGLQGIGKIEVRRSTGPQQFEQATRYFLTSLTYENINNFMRAVRKHWDIEINLHWSLDVSFKEDLSRVRAGHAAENLAIVRRIALNLLKQEKTNKRGVTCKRKRAGWDNKYLLKVLTADSNLKNKQKTAEMPTLI